MPQLEDFFRLGASRAELARLNNFIAFRPSCAERMANGKALRRNVPRSSHAEFRRSRGRPDPVSILQAQNATRIKELVPVRMARMLTSPFAFLRGSAAIMAGDLANSPRTDLEVMACGDMHLMNFGLFASAERNLVFAINDFDEVLPGPWEWDVKRLAASAAVAALFVGGNRTDAEQAARAEDRRRLLSRYRIIDVARKVVGVGSVGISCWVVLLEEHGAGNPLFLQVKEARESVLARYLDRKRAIKQQGRRVVIGQRMIQGSPDIFLGWGPVKPVNGSGHYYVRQLADMKGGLNFNEGDREALGGLAKYCGLCGWALALAHAKSGDPAIISGYCGTGDALPDAISKFSLAYLEQTERDHAALQTAARAGRITVAEQA
jgi:hypothetical protein